MRRMLLLQVLMTTAAAANTAMARDLSAEFTGKINAIHPLANGNIIVSEALPKRDYFMGFQKIHVLDKNLQPKGPTTLLHGNLYTVAEYKDNVYFSGYLDSVGDLAIADSLYKTDKRGRLLKTFNSGYTGYYHRAFSDGRGGFYLFGSFTPQSVSKDADSIRFLHLDSDFNVLPADNPMADTSYRFVLTAESDSEMAIVYERELNAGHRLRLLNKLTLETVADVSLANKAQPFFLKPYKGKWLVGHSSYKNHVLSVVLSHGTVQSRSIEGGFGRTSNSHVDLVGDELYFSRGYGKAKGERVLFYVLNVTDLSHYQIEGPEFKHDYSYCQASSLTYNSEIFVLCPAYESLWIYDTIAKQYRLETKFDPERALTRKLLHVDDKNLLIQLNHSDGSLIELIALERDGYKPISIAQPNSSAQEVFATDDGYVFAGGFEFVGGVNTHQKLVALNKDTLDVDKSFQPQLISKYKSFGRIYDPRIFIQENRMFAANSNHISELDPLTGREIQGLYISGEGGHSFLFDRENVYFGLSPNNNKENQCTLSNLNTKEAFKNWICQVPYSVPMTIAAQSRDMIFGYVSRLEYAYLDVFAYNKKTFQQVWSYRHEGHFRNNSFKMLHKNNTLYVYDGTQVALALRAKTGETTAWQAPSNAVSHMAEQGKFLYIGHRDSSGKHILIKKDAL